MDKVFDREALNPSRANHLIPVDVREPPPAAPLRAKPDSRPTAASSIHWLLLIVSGTAVAGAVNSSLLLERIRSEVGAPAEPKIEPQLPLPPPEPEWLTSLEPPAPPITPRLALSPVAPQPLPVLALTPMPQLTGVVQGSGGNSSAIFQVRTTSLSAGTGKSIGNSGWRLGSISSGGAIISQRGQQRTLSIGGLF